MQLRQLSLVFQHPLRTLVAPLFAPQLDRLLLERSCHALRRGVGAILLAAGLATALTGTAMAAGQSIELVLPIAPGGAMDIAGRAIADELARRLEEPVVVLNKPGAGTILGARYVAEQGKEDGRSLLLGAMAMTTGQFRKGGGRFEIASLAPVAYVGWQVIVLYVRAGLPVTTFAEFVKWAKSKPEGVSFASSGYGTTPHLAAEQIAVRTGIKIVHVPYGGSSVYIPALLGGHVDAVFDAPSRRPLAKSGELRALLVGSSKPIPDWAELPTADAAGLPGFKSGGWYGVFVSARTPIELQRKLNSEINAVLAVPAVREKLLQLGIEPANYSSQAEFASLISTERDRLVDLVKARKLVFD